MAALGEHLTAGRISLDEYGDRSAHAVHAQTRGELAALFVDLPAPHPDLTAAVVGVGPPVPVASAPTDGVPALPPQQHQLTVRRAVKTAERLLWVVGVPLLFIIGRGDLWWLVFVPVALSLMASQIPGGDSGDRQRRRRRRR